MEHLRDYSSLPEKGIITLHRECVEAFKALQADPRNCEKENALKAALYCYGYDLARKWPRMDIQQPVFDRIFMGKDGDFTQGVLTLLVQAARDGSVKYPEGFMSRSFTRLRIAYMRTINNRETPSSIDYSYYTDDSGRELTLADMLPDPNEGRDKEHKLQTGQLLERIENYIKTKGGKNLNAMEMHVYDAMSHSDIARAGNITERGVITQLKRARDNIKQKFGTKYEELHTDHGEWLRRERDKPSGDPDERIP